MTKSVQYIPIWSGLYTFWGFEVHIQTSYATLKEMPRHSGKNLCHNYNNLINT
jgi:hypothetical protein